MAAARIDRALNCAHVSQHFEPLVACRKCVEDAVAGAVQSEREACERIANEHLRLKVPPLTWELYKRAMRERAK